MLDNFLVRCLFCAVRPLLTHLHLPYTEQHFLLRGSIRNGPVQFLLLLALVWLLFESLHLVGVRTVLSCAGEGWRGRQRSFRRFDVERKRRGARRGGRTTNTLVVQSSDGSKSAEDDEGLEEGEHCRRLVKRSEKRGEGAMGN